MPVSFVKFVPFRLHREMVLGYLQSRFTTAKKLGLTTAQDKEKGRFSYLN
jgi:hypothetical protein